MQSYGSHASIHSKSIFINQATFQARPLPICYKTSLSTFSSAGRRSEAFTLTIYRPHNQVLGAHFQPKKNQTLATSLHQWRLVSTLIKLCGPVKPTASLTTWETWVVCSKPCDTCVLSSLHLSRFSRSILLWWLTFSVSSRATQKTERMKELLLKTSMIIGTKAMLWWEKITWLMWWNTILVQVKKSRSRTVWASSAAFARRARGQSIEV